MSIRSLQTGVEKLTESLSRNTTESMTSQWRDIRNKIDSILLSTTTYKADETRQACRQLDDMPAEQRAAFITAKWGAICRQKVDPLLIQLQLLENKMRQ